MEGFPLKSSVSLRFRLLSRTLRKPCPPTSLRLERREARILGSRDLTRSWPCGPANLSAPRSPPTLLASEEVKRLLGGREKEKERKKHGTSVPECVKMAPGSSQGALGTSQRGLVAFLGHPNCHVEGSWSGLGSSLGPLRGVLGGTSLASLLEACRVPRAPFWRHVVAQGRVHSENGEKLDVDDLLQRIAYF